jgi:histidine triad (HIT) family protein
MAEPGDFDFYCEEALTGKTKIDIVYDSKDVLAFYHTKPAYEKHIVVIPKKHIHDLTQIKDSDLPILNEIIKVCRDIMKDYDYNKKGGRVLTNLGIFQDTPHLHFHVIAGKKIR